MTHKNAFVMNTNYLIFANKAFKQEIHLNPFSLHDALKHHFTSLKSDLIFLQQSVLE